jgi:uncharacterized protein (TIGR02266 family)
MSGFMPPNPDDAEALRLAELARAQDERRTSPRIDLHAEVTLDSETNFFQGFQGITENISDGGIFIATLSPPPLGDRVVMHLVLPGGTPFSCEGVVRWIRTNDADEPTGCGVQFGDLDGPQARLVRDLMSKLSREPLFMDV